MGVYASGFLPACPLLSGKHDPKWDDHPTGSNSRLILHDLCNCDKKLVSDEWMRIDDSDEVLTILLCMTLDVLRSITA